MNADLEIGQGLRSDLEIRRSGRSKLVNIAGHNLQIAAPLPGDLQIAVFPIVYFREKFYFNYLVINHVFMSFTYKILNQNLPHFITATIVDWADVFSRQTYRDIVVENLDFCIKRKGMVVYAFVIMTNHIHMIVQSKNEDLSDLLRDFKKYTARKIINAIQNEPESRRIWLLDRFRRAAGKSASKSTFQVWQHGNHAEEIFSENFLWSKLDYIHLNPVRAGMVDKASHYKYSSASNYVYGAGILEQVEVVDPPIVDTTKPGGVVKFYSY